MKAIPHTLCDSAVTHPARTTGVRPLSGAASYAPPNRLKNAETPLSADVFAPEDGRTPAQSPS